MKLKITTLNDGKVAILEPKGSLVGGEETDALREAVNDLLKKENKRLVIDLGKVTYMNSTAIGVLVSAHTSYANRSGNIVLCNVNKSINNIFVITKLSMIFAIEGDRMEAVASFS
ncbi:MAG: STAS domain-containing protein [Bacteroidota bacterium]|nr:STAS domain-containing protein [Bacteroidota bacterium]